MIKLGLVLATLAFAGSAPSSREAAQDKARTVPGGASKGVKACHEDIERFCKGVVPGEGRLGACLKGHKAELSKPCARWTRHGGEAHVDEAFKDLDKGPAKK